MPNRLYPYPRPDQYDAFLARIREQMKHVDHDSAVVEKAYALISSVVGELRLGTKHYVNGEVTADVLTIMQAMRDRTLLIEPTPERRAAFEKLCQEGSDDTTH